MPWSGPKYFLKASDGLSRSLALSLALRMSRRTNSSIEMPRRLASRLSQALSSGSISRTVIVDDIHCTGLLCQARFYASTKCFKSDSESKARHPEAQPERTVVGLVGQRLSNSVQTVKVESVVGSHEITAEIPFELAPNRVTVVVAVLGVVVFD